MFVLLSLLKCSLISSVVWGLHDMLDSETACNEWWCCASWSARIVSVYEGGAALDSGVYPSSEVCCHPWEFNLTRLIPLRLVREVTSSCCSVIAGAFFLSFLIAQFTTRAATTSSSSKAPVTSTRKAAVGGTSTLTGSSVDSKGGTISLQLLLSQ